MKTIIILVSLLASISLAVAYTPEQQNDIQSGLSLSFKLGQAYERATQGNDVAAFNALVNQWNAWVTKNFGQDITLLMEKWPESSDFQNTKRATTNEINSTIHSEVATRWTSAPAMNYTTNEINSPIHSEGISGGDIF